MLIGEIKQNKKKLRLFLALFFLLLAIPMAVLVSQAHQQLKLEAFHQHRIIAESLISRINIAVDDFISTEEQRPFTDYSFLNIAGEAQSNFLQRSPLAEFPIQKSIPGIIGYFQVDNSGQLTTPLLPRSERPYSYYGLSSAEVEKRTQILVNIRKTLTQNPLLQNQQDMSFKDASVVEKNSSIVKDITHSSIEEEIVSTIGLLSKSGKKKPASGKSEYIARERLLEPFESGQMKKRVSSQSYLGNIDELKLNISLDSLQERKNKKDARLEPANTIQAKRKTRKEQNLLPALSESISMPASRSTSKSINEIEQDSKILVQSAVPVSIFESEINPLEFSLLESGHFILYRKVWREGQRYIQGALVDRDLFLREMIKSKFQDSALSLMSNLIVAYQSNVIAAFDGGSTGDYLRSARDVKGELLFRSHLQAPFSNLELLVSVNTLPAGKGAMVIGWTSFVFILLLSIGVIFIYRLGIRQLDYHQQQQNFISSVSHELKTPLTSIRMYGEILKGGWASEEKQKQYYDFIYDESERLSRLIANVLQLAKLNRNDLSVDIRPVLVSTLMDNVRSKIISQVESAGFTLDIDVSSALQGKTIQVDPDAFSQIIINLVDNSLKFSVQSALRKIDLKADLLSSDEVVFSIRDYGQGIPKKQLKKIFDLFYRLENELTRETTGTGIGLALVQQLAATLNGRIEVMNKQPGVEFRFICGGSDLD